MLNIVKSAFGGKKILIGLAVLSLVLGVAVPVLAAETVGVTATVTPQSIAVSVDPTSVDYGVLSLSTSDAVRSTAESGTITATNDSNITANLNIKGSDSTSWTLSSTPAATGTVGADQFVHRFDAGTTFTDGEAVALDKTTYKSLAIGIGASGTQDFVLQMNMPTSSTDPTSQQTTAVTVQAVAP